MTKELSLAVLIFGSHFFCHMVSKIHKGYRFCVDASQLQIFSFSSLGGVGWGRWGVAGQGGGFSSAPPATDDHLSVIKQ